MIRRRLDVWPTVTVAGYGRRRPVDPPFPLDHPSCVLHRRARHALFQGARGLGLGPGDEILVPAYHHGSEVEALRRTGARCLFYGSSGDLAPDADELEVLRTPATRALHVTHYLGFPQDAPRWRRWCDDRGMLLLEDAAQSWLASVGDRPVGSFGDLAVFCLYKSVAVPNGAALVSPRPFHLEQEAGGVGAMEIARRHVGQLVRRNPRLHAVAERRRGAAVDGDEFGLDDDGFAPPGRLLAPLAGRLARGAAELRRANYRTLIGALGRLVPEPFDRLPAGASPWIFPLRAVDKPALVASLARNGVEALDFWSYGHPLLPAGTFPAVDERRRTTIGVPVHQGLSGRDLSLIVEAVNDAMRMVK